MVATWSEPSEGNIYGLMNVNCDRLVHFIAQQKESGSKMTVTHCVLKAVALAFRNTPSLNSLLIDDTFVPKKTIDVCCLVAVDEGKDLAFVNIKEADNKSLKQIGEEIQTKSNTLREHKDEEFNKSKPLMKTLPVFVLRFIVHFFGYLTNALDISVPALGLRGSSFGTVMITNVGMMGVEQAFAPHTPFARVPITLLLGSIEKRPVVVDDKIVIQNQMTLNATIDHRYVDGTEIAKLSKAMRYHLENPDTLDSGKTLVEETKSKMSN